MGSAALAGGTAWEDLDLAAARRAIIAVRDAAEADVDARAQAAELVFASLAGEVAHE